MSTLGRKAMKKALQRLREDAKRDANKYLELRDKASGHAAPHFIVELIGGGDKMLISLIDYIMALEDYSLELDEAWDKLLKSAEQTRKAKPKPVQKKEETSYIE